MTTEIATNKSFQERMFERVRSQMGDLMTDEELKKIVNQAVQKAFFEPQGAGYGSKQPLFVELIHNEMRSKVASAVTLWLQDNPELVQKAIQDVINEGILRAVMQALENRMSWPAQQLAEALKAKGVFN